LPHACNIGLLPLTLTSNLPGKRGDGKEVANEAADEVAKLKKQIVQEHEELTELQHAQLQKEQELYEALDRAEAAERGNQELAGSLETVKSELEEVQQEAARRKAEMAYLESQFGLEVGCLTLVSVANGRVACECARGMIVPWS
jgi:chromosome segregation ATPase